MTHVNKLCLTVVQTSTKTSAHSAVLDFYETAARLASNPATLRSVSIVIPPTPLVYILHFSSSAVTLSRLCGVLAQYKEGFQIATTTYRTQYPARYINEFNSFLMDICNCLWRSRAFNAKDANSNACLMPAETVERLAAYTKGLNVGVPLASLFTLSTAPSLGSLSTSYLRDLEDAEMEQGTTELEARHAGPVTRASLGTLARDGGLDLSWDDYRLGVLGYLENRGLDGIGLLMSNTMTTLMARRT
jgi:centromere protein I